MTTKLIKLVPRNRYARNRKGKPIKLRIGDKPVPRADRKVPWATIRCADLEKYFDDRYGQLLSDDDAGRDDAKIMLNSLAFRQAIDRLSAMRDWIDRRAPWLGDEERTTMISEVFRKPKLYKPDTLARKLGLTYARRQRLGITTIGSTDVDADGRKRLRAEKDRERKRKAREARGCKPRSEYEGQSVEKEQPWITEGVSRRTWYRLRRQAKPHYAADELVPRIWFAKVTVSVA